MGNEEVLWYNGEFSAYELLDIDPTALSKTQIKNEAEY